MWYVRRGHPDKYIKWNDSYRFFQNSLRAKPLQLFAVDLLLALFLYTPNIEIRCVENVKKHWSLITEQFVSKVTWGLGYKKYHKNNLRCSYSIYYFNFICWFYTAYKYITLIILVFYIYFYSKLFEKIFPQRRYTSTSYIIWKSITTQLGKFRRYTM